MCKNADIDWYVRMPSDPPLVDPKVERLLQLYKEEDITAKPTFSVIDNWIP